MSHELVNSCYVHSFLVNRNDHINHEQQLCILFSSLSLDVCSELHKSDCHDLACLMFVWSLLWHDHDGRK